MTAKNEPNGAWEIRGTIGTKIEIDEPKIVVLWRNSPVLSTTFKRKKRDGGEELVLKNRGLRYENSDADYAELRELFYHDGKLEMTEYFPISGLSTDTLTKTENSRYGNYTVENERLRELKGKWKEKDGSYELEFKGDKMLIDGKKQKICLLRPNSGFPEGLKIADSDPSCYGVMDFYEMYYHGDTITASIMVCDAKPIILEFRRVK